MKKLLSLSLAIAMVCLLVGCSCGETKKAEQETTTIAWTKGESLFGSQIRAYADACKSNKTKDIKKKQKLTTGFGEVAKEKNFKFSISFCDAHISGWM